MYRLQLFLEVFIIGIGGVVCKKMRPADRLLNPQGKILTLPHQGIVLIDMHWSFHNNIILCVKVLCRIILLVLLIGIIFCWYFCCTFRGCLLLSNLFTDLQNPFNKVVKSFVINFSVNRCLWKVFHIECPVIQPKQSK